MTNLNSLSSWIQTQHLQVGTLQSYRQGFESHPARLIILRRFLQDSVAQRLSNFLRDEAEFRLEYGLYSTGDEAASDQAWLNAKEEDRFFRFSKIVGAFPQYAMSPNMLTYLRFRMAFQAPDFRNFFEQLSGLSLAWSDDFGSHSMKRGDFLRPHSDHNRNRSLALVIYLSPNWGPYLGGALNVIDSQGHTIKIEPEYNSMVVFDVAAGTTHFVDPIRSEAQDNGRLTIGGWYRKPS